MISVKNYGEKTIFGFWKLGQRRPTLFGESVDVPEAIVVDWSLCFSRLPVHPESHFSV